MGKSTKPRGAAPPPLPFADALEAGDAEALGALLLAALRARNPAVTAVADDIDRDTTYTDTIVFTVTEEAEAETTLSPSMKILGVVGLAATAFGGAVASGAVF